MAECIVRVNGRVFEKSQTAERKDEIVGILKNLYPEAEITAERTRRPVPKPRRMAKR